MIARHLGLSQWGSRLIKEGSGAVCGFITPLQSGFEAECKPNFSGA
jgi:hypothetical protein